MDLPGSLPELTYLLAVDPDRRRVVAGDRLGKLLRAAALEQLTTAGRLTDVDGRPRVSGREPAGDPLLDAVLAQLRDAPKPRPWKHWVRKDARRARTEVRDRLEAAGVVAVERRRLWGVFPADRVTLRAHREVKELRARTARAITGTEPVARLEPETAALAAFAALGELRTVTTGRQRRQARKRIKDLVARGGPSVRAAKKVLADDQAAAAAG
jgi:hypothetical protein